MAARVAFAAALLTLHRQRTALLRATLLHRVDSMSTVLSTAALDLLTALLSLHHPPAMHSLLLRSLSTLASLTQLHSCAQRATDARLSAGRPLHCQ